ncbi:MAG: hypothetical protein ABFD29_06160 [Anaerolineaceae bacterium]
MIKISGSVHGRPKSSSNRQGSIPRPGLGLPVCRQETADLCAGQVELPASDRVAVDRAVLDRHRLQSLRAKMEQTGNSLINP